jgi:hypothetical protein
MLDSKSRDPHHDAKPSPGVRRVEGTAADGRVTVTVSPTGELLGVHLYPGPYHPEDPPGLENMGDMVVEALIDAKTKALGLPYYPGPDR